MLEQQGNALTFLAFYTESKVAKTGLTVTADVWEGTSEIITAGSAIEIGDGLYYYTLASGSVDANANYVAVFKTATSTVDQQHIPALWVVGRTWVNRVDEATSAAKTLTTGERTSIGTAVWASATRTLTSISAVAADVWAYATRTLTQSAASVTAALSGSDITITRGDTLTVNFTGLGNISARTKLYFTAKDDRSKADTASLIKIEETAGLQIIREAAAGTAANGSLTVTNATTGAVTLVLKAVETAEFDTLAGDYDIQMVTASGVTTLTAGHIAVSPDVTRAIS